MLSEGEITWNFDDPNQSAHRCLSAQNEDSTNTVNILWKEFHGKGLRCFFLKKENMVGEQNVFFMTNSNVRF